MEALINTKYTKLMAFALMLGAFVGLFGETALNMALTDVMNEYDITASAAQWLTTGYLLTMAVLIPVSAFLIKWFSTRQLVAASLSISGLGAVLAALSPNFELLLLGRIVQALGTGVILPLMLSVLMVIFPVHKRGIVMGLMGLVITAAPAIGPTASGVIITTIGWSYIFWISAALYALLLIYSLIVVENVSTVTKPKLDYVSVVYSTIGFGGIVYGLSMYADNPFTSVLVWMPLILGIASLILFARRQTVLETPLINLEIFKFPMFTFGTLMMFLSLFIILSTSILMPLYLKGALLFTAAAAGLILLPGNILNFIMSPVVGAMYNKIGPKFFVVTGFALITAANIGFLIVLGDATPVWQVIVLFMIMFIGLPMTIMPSQTNAMNQLPHQLYADGSAAMNTLTQVGGALGTAIAVTLFTIGQSSAANEGAEFGIAAGTHFAFYFITAISLIGLIGSLFIYDSTKENS